MQNNTPQPDSPPAAVVPAPQTDIFANAAELAQFEQFKRQKLAEQTRARIAKVECDCLSPVATAATLKTLCREAERLGMGGIVVLPAYVRQCVAYLGDNPSCSLIAALSYPHGGDSTEGKVAAVKRAVKDGVDEVEVCAPHAAVAEGNMAYVKRQFKKLIKAARPRALRIVVDFSLLSREGLARVCNCAADCGVHVIRIINAGGLSPITAAKSALRDRCLIKADGQTIAEIEEGEAIGVAIANCTNAMQLCSQLLSTLQS